MKKFLIYVKNYVKKIGFINEKNGDAGMITIFMLHRVCPSNPNKLTPNETNMRVSPEFLERFIITLKANGYGFISLDDVYNILTKGEKVTKKIVITLDDGYKDNYTIAYPIFKKHNIPFCIYITTCFPEKSVILWWYILEDLLLENEIIKLGNDIVYECKTKEQKDNAFMQIRQFIIALKKDNFLNDLNLLFCNYKMDWFSKNKELCLDWEEIIELSKDPLCTIGSHTKNHYSLSQLSYEEVKEEILGANALLEKKLGKRIYHFAYPFGGRGEAGRREFDIVKSLGFKTATTTRQGMIYMEHNKFLECLPRIMLTEKFDIDSLKYYRKKKVVTE